MKRQSGFTLIELVVVIVTLGILAVTAAPRFLDISSDAKKSTLKGLKGAVNSAFTLVHSKAVLEGKEGELDTTLSNGIDIRYGYPINWDKREGLSKAVSGLSSDFAKKTQSVDGRLVWQFSFKGSENWVLNDDKGCSIAIRYPAKPENTMPPPPTIKLHDGGC